VWRCDGGTNAEPNIPTMHDPSLPPSECETFGLGQFMVQTLQGPIDGIESSGLKEFGDCSALAGQYGKEMKRWRGCTLAWSAKSRWGGWATFSPEQLRGPRMQWNRA